MPERAVPVAARWRWRLGVDLAGTFNLVGALLRYLGLTFIFPALLAAGYDEPVWPFAVSGVVTAAAGVVLEAATAGRERIGNAQAAVFAMRDDEKNLYAATLAKLRGVRFTVAIVHESASHEVFDAAGVDAAVNPRTVTAEEMVRFAHDPRISQLAMLEGDRFEVLDITVREDSELCGIPFRDLPMTGSLIGAIVRDGEAVFPHGEDRLLAGDRAIIFTESSRVANVEKVL